MTMSAPAKWALLAELVDSMHENGSWVGETHIQKTMLFLQKLSGNPTEYTYVLYKHGPFSFDLHDELGTLVAGGVLSIQQNPAPYGPSFRTTDVAIDLRNRYQTITDRYRKIIEFVSRRISTNKVVDLEKLATALYIKNSTDKSIDDYAKEMVSIKPHIDYGAAIDAIKEVNEIAKEWDSSP